MLVLTRMSTPLRSIPTLPAWTRQPFFVSITLKCLFLWGRGKFHFPFIEHTSLSFRAGLTTVIPLLKISEHECFPDAPCNFQQVTQGFFVTSFSPFASKRITFLFKQHFQESLSPLWRKCHTNCKLLLFEIQEKLLWHGSFFKKKSVILVLPQFGGKIHLRLPEGF